MNQVVEKSRALISIVTPVSRMAGKLENLKKWLKEIATQDVEVILIHDLQDDYTSRDLQELVIMLGNRQIKLIEQYCGSPGKARNLGISAATGEWICFWDSDDTPVVGSFLKMIIEANERGVDVCIGSYAEKSKKGLVTHILDLTKSNSPIDLVDNPGIWRMAFRRSIIDNTRFLENSMAEDQFFICSLNLYEYKIYYSKTVVYHYHTSVEGQLSKNRKAISEIYLSVNELFKLQAEIKTEQISFVRNVIARLIFTGILKSNPHGKIALFRVVKNINHKEQFILSKMIIHVLFQKFGKYIFPLSKKVVVVKLYGGLGNQLFQLAAGIYLAGSRKLSLESDLRSTDGAVMQLNISDDIDYSIRGFRQSKFDLFNLLFNMTIRISTWHEKRIIRKWVFPMVASLLALIYSLKNRICIWIPMVKGIGFSKFNLARGNLLLIGYFQSFRWTESPEILAQMRNLFYNKKFANLESYIRYLDHNKVLAIHYRLGDYETNPQFGRLGSCYYINAIKKAINKDRFDSIWIFSDDIISIKQSNSYLNDFGIEVKWIEDTCLSASDQMYLMAKCSGIIMANSSFSWWSARLSNSTVKIAPEPWFSDITSPVDLIPPNWITIPSCFE